MQSSSFIAIAAIVGGMCISAIVLVGIFAREQMSILPWIVCPLCLLGIALGYFASKSSES